MNKIKLGTVFRLTSLARKNVFYFSKGILKSIQIPSTSSIAKIRTRAVTPITNKHQSIYPNSTKRRKNRIKQVSMMRLTKKEERWIPLEDSIGSNRESHKEKTNSLSKKLSIILKRKV